MVSTKIFVVTEDNINKFCHLVHDFNPIHLDEDYARQTKFCARIAPGIMLAGYLSGLIAERYENCIYLEQSLRFVYPAYIGNELTIIITPLEQEGRKLNLQTQIFYKEQIIVDGYAKISLPSDKK